MDDRTYVAECFWPGVTEQDVGELDVRAHASVEEAARVGESVRYLGSILMRTDEVVLCRFQGAAAAVRRAAERAAIPFERIVETIQTQTKEEHDA